MMELAATLAVQESEASLSFAPANYSAAETSRPYVVKPAVPKVKPSSKAYKERAFAPRGDWPSSPEQAISSPAKDLPMCKFGKRCPMSNSSVRDSQLNVP
jgi:hypothetical protein